jgi:hypothetical protein
MRSLQLGIPNAPPQWLHKPSPAWNRFASSLERFHLNNEKLGFFQSVVMVPDIRRYPVVEGKGSE